MKITSVHLCQYSLDDLYELVDQDLAGQGLSRTNKQPVRTVVEGKETWTFEAISTSGPQTGPVKPRVKGKGGRPKKVAIELPLTTEKEMAGVVAASNAPFPVPTQ